MNKDDLLGDAVEPFVTEYGETRFRDYKISFFTHYANGKKVLDLGCVNHNPRTYQSKYWVHKALCKVAERCKGLDLYEDGVEFLQARGFDIVCGDAEDFDLDETFDVAVAGDLIEHLNNAGKFLECVYRHLSPAGVLVLSTPNPWYWRFVIKATFSWNVRPNPEHVCWYCGATLKALLHRFGFEIIEMAFGSRYLRDRIVPLPRYLKHTTLYVAARKSPDV